MVGIWSNAFHYFVLKYQISSPCTARTTFFAISLNPNFILTRTRKLDARCNCTFMMHISTTKFTVEIQSSRHDMVWCQSRLAFNAIRKYIIINKWTILFVCSHTHVISSIVFISFLSLILIWYFPSHFLKFHLSLCASFPSFARANIFRIGFVYLCSVSLYFFHFIVHRNVHRKAPTK